MYRYIKASESPEYIAENVVKFAKQHLNEWIDNGLSDVDIDDKIYDAVERFGDAMDDEKYYQITDCVLGQLEDEGLLDNGKYLYQLNK